MDEKPVEVSVVLPCLNEEKTLAACIRAAKQALRDADIAGEIVVADNGSEDRSPEIAVAEGARVVAVPHRGYGNALRHGFNEARGRFLVFLDSDMSYDFAYIPRFVEELRKGADLVIGSRLRGTIHRGAMPFAHRFVGTPVLTAMARLFFGCSISDINCGMRGLSREAFNRLHLRAGGMEFASEMVIRATLLKMRITELPVDFHPDQRDRPPHLRSFRDGWRHLRFMLLFCPRWLFFVPGSAMTLGGAVVIIAILLNVSRFFGLFTSLVALASTVLGVQTLLLGVAAQSFANLTGFQASRTLGRLRRFLTLEKGIVIGAVLSFGGVSLVAFAFIRILRFMRKEGYELGELDLASTKLALLGATLFITGFQILFTSFYLSLFVIEPIPTILRRARGTAPSDT